VAPGNLIIIIPHITSPHHPNAFMIQIRQILGMKTSQTQPETEIVIIIIILKLFTGAGI
jgi:hypothetical protein